jgi:ABC-type phosphate/phosphonate transport system substrate-binding protein
MIRFSLLVGSYAVVVLGAASAEQPPTPGIVRVALLKSMVRDVTPQRIEAMAANFQAVLKQQSALDGELVIVETAEDMQKRLANGEVRLGAFHGFEFAWMRNKNPDLVPLMLASPDPDALRSVLVVTKDSPAKSIADVRGQRLAMVSDAPEHSRLFLDRLCSKMNSTLKDVFPTIESPKSIEEALDRVVDGKIQVALLERNGLKMFERRKPARYARLRVLEESVPFPPGVLAYFRGRLGESTQKAFRDGMNNTDKSEQGRHLMQQMKIKRFESVPPEFEKQLAAVLKEYPPG